MGDIYIICIAIGIIIPLITLIFSGILDFFDGIFDGMTSAFDGIDFSIEIGDVSFCFLPMSLQSICAGLLFFGTAGRLIYNGSNTLIANIVAVIVGYIAAIGMQTIIKKLKKVENTTYNKDELLLFDAKVVNTIVANGFGSISVTTFDGITNTFPAKADEKDKAIKQDTIVSIVRFDKNVAIVIEKDLTIKYQD